MRLPVLPLLALFALFACLFCFYERSDGKGKSDLREIAMSNACTHTLPRPGEPTSYPPGSDGKLAVLAERFARGERLHHPLDARLQTAADVQAAGNPMDGRRRGGRQSKGISPVHQRWKARAWNPRVKKLVYVGLFQSEEAAIAARIAAEQRFRDGTG